MKKIFNSALFILLVSVISFSSCEKKYVDGPHYSLRSAKSRVAGDWSLEKIMYNNVDMTADADYADVVKTKFNIEKGGTYAFVGGWADAGTWKLGEDKDDILLQSSTPAVPLQTFRLLKLKNKEMWWKQTQTNGDVIELHLKQ